MLPSVTAVIVTNNKHYLIWNKPILIFIFKCKRPAVHFQMTPVYESILRYIINRGVCKTSNDLSGVFFFFLVHIRKGMSKQATMERSLINIKDSFLFHRFLNQKKIIKLIINDQRTIFFHCIGSSIKWNTFTRFYVGLSNHVTDGVPIENRNALLWQKTDRNARRSFNLRVFEANKIMA